MKMFKILLISFFLLASLFSPAQSQFCSGPTYVVQRGDSLSSISVKCDVPYPALIGINVEISDPDLIRPGQVIRLEAGVPLYNQPAIGAPQEGGLQGDGDYIARAGDSLARIAYLYSTTVPEILRYNPEIGHDLVIHIGQRIHMPPDARKQKGWVGVSTRFVGPWGEFEMRAVDFPPYTDVDINLGELDPDDNQLYFYETIDARTDARGQLRKTISIPSYAWYDEIWIVEVVTTEKGPIARALSPTILIDDF